MADQDRNQDLTDHQTKAKQKLRGIASKLTAFCSKNQVHNLNFMFIKVNSIQKACVKCFAVHKLKFEILQMTWKNETKNIRLLVFSFSSIDLAFWCFLFCFFMWFARFQILICEPQSIWRKLLVLSWLYPMMVLHNRSHATLEWLS